MDKGRLLHRFLSILVNRWFIIVSSIIRHLITSLWSFKAGSEFCWRDLSVNRQTISVFLRSSRLEVRILFDDNLIIPFDFKFPSSFYVLLLLYNRSWNSLFHLVFWVQLRVDEGVSDYKLCSSVCRLNFLTRDDLTIINLIPISCFWAFSFDIKSFLKLRKLMKKRRPDMKVFLSRL